MITAEFRTPLAQFDSADSDVVRHRRMMRPPLLERQCLACGVVDECDPSQPCETCGASAFHLIPLAPSAA